jgi:hypothetical protein
MGTTTLSEFYTWGCLRTFGRLAALVHYRGTLRPHPEAPERLAAWTTQIDYPDLLHQYSSFAR